MIHDEIQYEIVGAFFPRRFLIWNLYKKKKTGLQNWKSAHMSRTYMGGLSPTSDGRFHFDEGQFRQKIDTAENFI